MDNDLFLLGVLVRRSAFEFKLKISNTKFTLRICTSVAGQITLILRSRSRVSPNHPKSHVYYNSHQP